jgi:hypothetical protein
MMLLLHIVQALCYEISLTSMYSLPRKTVGRLKIQNYRPGDRVYVMTSDKFSGSTTEWQSIGDFSPNGPKVEYEFDPTLPSNKFYSFAINKNGHLSYSKPCKKTGLNSYEIYQPKNGTFEPVKKVDKPPKDDSSGSPSLNCLCGLALLAVLWM